MHVWGEGEEGGVEYCSNGQEEVHCGDARDRGQEDDFCGHVGATVGPGQGGGAGKQGGPLAVRRRG